MNRSTPHPLSCRQRPTRLRQGPLLLVLLTALASSPASAQSVAGIYVGTGGGAVGYAINWSDRGGGGSWGVSSEAFAGFTLTSLINGVEGGELSWANNVRNLGVGGPGSYGTTASINRNQDSSIVEAIRLDLPARDEPVGPDLQYTYSGLAWLAFDRLAQGQGSTVTISGFRMDPGARWLTNPFTGAEILLYDEQSGQIRFATTADSLDFGLLALDNPDATLSDEPISVTFSNDLAVAPNGAYGLVGWGYLYEESAISDMSLVFADTTADQIVDGFAFLQGLGFVYLDYYPFIFHYQYGWLYSAMSRWNEGGWFFDYAKGEWWASSATLYPWIFSATTGWRYGE